VRASDSLSSGFRREGGAAALPRIRMIPRENMGLEFQGESNGGLKRHLEGRGSVGDVVGDEAQHLQRCRGCLHKHSLVYLQRFDEESFQRLGLKAK
jgi:hypothetical protein